MKVNYIEENKFLQGGVFLLFLLTLFFGADSFSLFEVEAETGVAGLNVLSEGDFGVFTEASFLGKIITAGAISTIGASEWGLRMPNLLLLIFAFFAFYKLGAKIFSARAAMVTLLLAVGSFPLVLMGKLAVWDIWVFAISLIQYLLLIYQLKKPNVFRSVLMVALSLIFLWVQPISSLVFHLVLLGFFFFLHPKKRNIQWHFLLITAIHIVYLVGFNHAVITDGFMFSYAHNIVPFLLATFIGMLFCLGFFPVAILHVVRRLREREELAILMVAGIMASLFSMSLLAHFLLLFLVGKQITAYTQANYPYRNLAKIFTIIQVVIGFFIAMYLIMSGYNWYQGLGFRKALFFGTPYWGFGIYTLVSMYVIRRKHLLLSIIIGGVLSNFLFWTQIMPLWDAERNMYQEVFKDNSISKEETIFINTEKNPSLEFYQKIQLEENVVTYSSSLHQGNEKIIKKVKGRAYPWEEMQEWIVFKRE